MTDKQLKVVLWIVFTALFFGCFCGVSYLFFKSIDWSLAFLFFVVLGLLDKKGIAYLVDHYVSKRNKSSKNPSESNDNEPQ